MTGSSIMNRLYRQQAKSDNQPQDGRRVNPLFSERDVMLICYADHVQEPGIKTLKTMNKFLGQYAKGIINKIHFLTFYPWTSDDGFSVVDYYKVHEPYGDWKDIKELAFINYH